MASAEYYRKKSLQSLVKEIDLQIDMLSEKGKFHYVWDAPNNITNTTVNDVKEIFKNRGFNIRELSDYKLVISWE